MPRGSCPGARLSPLSSGRPTPDSLGKYWAKRGGSRSFWSASYVGRLAHASDYECWGCRATGCREVAQEPPKAHWRGLAASAMASHGPGTPRVGVPHPLGGWAPRGPLYGPWSSRTSFIHPMGLRWFRGRPCQLHPHVFASEPEESHPPFEGPPPTRRGPISLVPDRQDGGRAPREPRRARWGDAPWGSVTQGPFPTSPHQGFRPPGGTMEGARLCGRSWPHTPVCRWGFRLLDLGGEPGSRPSGTATAGCPVVWTSAAPRATNRGVRCPSVHRCPGSPVTLRRGRHNLRLCLGGRR